MIALLWIAAVVLGYGVLTIWIAHAIRAFHRHDRRLAGGILCLPLIALIASIFVAPGWRFFMLLIVMGGGTLLAARLLGVRDELFPRRETKPVLLHLVLISASALFLAPLVWLVVTSLKTDAQMESYPPVWIPHPALWQNYPEAIKFLPAGSGHGLLNVLNTLIIGVMSVVGTVLSSSLVAYSFARLRWPGRNWLFGILLATMMLPDAVTMMPRFMIFRSLHWIDTLLPLWVPSFFAAAFNVFLLRQFFMGIPNELEDAAKIDGCTPLATWWRVMLPLVKPALAAVAIITFLGAWKDFMGPLIYISSPEKMPVSYVLQLYNSVHNSEPGLLMAATTLVVLPVIVLFFFTQRYFIEGVTLTGLGGR